jgi:hypothetical protein
MCIFPVILGESLLLLRSYSSFIPACQIRHGVKLDGAPQSLVWIEREGWRATGE